MTTNLPASETTARPGNRRRNLFIAGGIALALLVACCAVVVAIVALDPFGWNLLGLLFGRADPLAASMPADTAYYMSVDLSQMTPWSIQRVVKPFQDATGSTETINLDRIQQELDKSLLSSLHLTYKDDLAPWIGQFAALGMKDITSGIVSSGDMPSFIFAIESRSNAKADAFLQKLADESQSQSGATVEKSEYGGATIFSQTPAYGTGIAFARSGNAVLLATTVADLKSAIDAQKGDSLAGQESYRNAIGALPSGRILTFYMDSAKFLDSYMSILDSMALSGIPGASADTGQLNQLKDLLQKSEDQLGGMAMSLKIVDAGIQMDAVSIAKPGAGTGDSAIQQNAKPATEVIKLLPENTFLFSAGTMPQKSWASIRDTLLSMGGTTKADYDEAMRAFKEQFGINPDTDLLPYLDGEMAVALFPSPDGLLAQSANTDLGGILLVETNNGPALLDTLGKLQPFIAQSQMPFDRHQNGDLTYYLVTEQSSGTDVVALGVGGKYLMVGSSAKTLEDIQAQKTSIASNAAYQKAIRTLPGGMSPSMYLDFQGMLNILRGSMAGSAAESFDEETKALQPLLALIAGSEMRSGNTVHSTIVLVLAQPK